MTNHTDLYTEITNKMIDALEAGVAPWQKSWASVMPMRMNGKKAYRGINILLLAGNGEAGSNWWGTYKQINAMGGKVRKGEKSSVSVFWKIVESKVDGSKFPIMRKSPVFNATQVEWADGMPEYMATVVNSNATIEDADAIWNNYTPRPSLTHGGDVACYIPSLDAVKMPTRESFDTIEDYYSTLFHEATHSTGHATRLNRDGVTNIASFGSHAYGVEELTAEMGAAFLCGIAGIETTHDSSASYLASWLKTIKGNPKMIVAAASAAQKACDKILGVSFDKA